MFNYFARKRIAKAGRFWSKAIDEHIELYRLNLCVARVEALVRCARHLREVQRGFERMQLLVLDMQAVLDERGASLPPCDNLHPEVYD